jgi:type IV pilus assembly protein PilB
LASAQAPRLAKARRRLGELLIEKRLLQADELEKALALQRERPEKLGRVLTDLGFVSWKDVLATLSEQLDVALITAREFPAVAAEVEGISLRFCRSRSWIPR